MNDPPFPSETLVLIVEDDPEIRFATVRVLQTAGYRTAEAADGGEALRKAVETRPDIVLLDHILPDMDGSEVCARIKENPLFFQTLVIMISGLRKGVEDQIRGLATGADGYITRPIGNQELVARINAFARIQQRGRSLRQRALERIRQVGTGWMPTENDSIEHVIHELQVHQAELEIQNEELQRSQIDLEKARDRFAILYHHAPVGYVTLDAAGMVREANHTLGSMLDASLDQIVGSAFGKWLTSEDRETFLRWYPHFFRHPAGKRIDVHLRGSEGEISIVSLFGRKWSASQGRNEETSEFVHMVVLDVTQERLAQECLQRSELKYRIVSENTYNWEFWIGPDGEVRYCSPSSERISGYPPEAFEHDPALFRSIIHPEDRLLWDDHEGRVCETRGCDAIECRIVLPDGTVRWVAHHCHAVFDADGRYWGTRGCTRDITEEKSVQQEKVRFEERLRQGEKLETIGTLAAGVAHDFNNLLMIIMGNAELLTLDMSPDSSGLHHVAEIVEAARGGAELTRQLLAFGRKQPVQLRSVDLNRAVGNMQKMLRRLLPEDIRIELLLADRMDLIQADVNQIEQVVMNLCVNARDAMPEGGTLTILTRTIDGEMTMDLPEASVCGQWVCLSVRDTGCGMDEETRKRIFEPFFTTKQKGKGTGLGLSTVYGIVRQHGGWIDVHSTPGAGSRFDVYFPKSELPTQAEKPRAEKNTPVSNPAGGKVLVVEDNPSIRSVVCDVLKRNGYDVREATDGLNALQVLSEWGQPIDLLITDMVMPAMGGKALALKLREQMPKLKVLFMSGYTEERLPEMGKIQSGEAFILKPFPVERLMKAVRELMQEEAEI